MKKKLLYLILLISIFLLNSNVSALNILGDTTKKDVCGLSLPSNVPLFTNGLFNVIKILVPIILIIMGMIDFTKAVMANDEKKMKESTSSFIRRLIAAIFIFFIVAIVQFVFKKVTSESGFTNCMNCVLNNKCSDTTEDYNSSKKYCDAYSIFNCPATDSYGNACQASNVTTSCRYKCTSLTNLELCKQADYCDVSGNKCIDKVASGGGGSTPSSNSSGNSSDNSSSNSGTEVTSTCISDCQNKTNQSEINKCEKECEKKQSNTSCSECIKITKDSSTRKACLKNCKPSTSTKNKSTKRDICDVRATNVCTKSKDFNGATCIVKNNKCQAKCGVLTSQNCSKYSYCTYTGGSCRTK